MIYMVGLYFALHSGMSTGNYGILLVKYSLLRNLVKDLIYITPKITQVG